ncbi:hypothetical protein GCM10027277_13370 [Pseudoduganella ginsengisoli]|uniref:SagB/ThcOx family dehydrogenase n=1 Tax=Pseudoduganella ginsengisoli TaxID=1462440 RepID=A0A6L6PW33_9BURK|nr:nitroreductase family protein [Pseudoduganella ginsengisoli]MTW01727.1 SagB/ThcOx family dehydrogenase [Pseudoduganella ginsengisoli]
MKPHAETRAEVPLEVPLIRAQAFELDADFSALGIALRTILQQRRSQFEFSPDPVPHYRFSRLLWAACGCNREGTSLHTVPSVCGGVAVDLYVANSDGLYLFDSARMVLAPRSAADVRSRDAHGVPAAPLELIYVANTARMAAIPAGERLWQAALDAGFMAENVSLFCAAEGLATCMLPAAGRSALAQSMALQEGERIVLLQQVGMPKNAPERNPWL